MSKDIGVIEQLSHIDARPTYYVNRRIAEQLHETGQAIWASAGKTLRKTPKHGRLKKDGEVMAGRAFAVRGLSAQVGTELAEATRSKQDRNWALPMLAQIRMQLEVPEESLV